MRTILSSTALLVASAVHTPHLTAQQAIEKQLNTAIPVTIRQTDTGYQLYRGGKPYAVKGAGTNSTDLENIKRHGGNSVRTWAVDGHIEPAQQLLDKAHALGMTVSLCLEFGKERWGFDFSDKEAVDTLMAQTLERVMRFKDHPALLTWIIGNEVNLNYTDSRVFDAVNRAAELIKKIDSNHPVTTALAGFDKRAIKDIQERAPSLDFISFQAYASLNRFPEFIQQSGFSKPFLVTEWGAFGHWEGTNTDWGAPIEQTSSEKAEHYMKSYNNVIAGLSDQVIGSYVFLWGQKQERTPTWYGMELASGEETQAMDVMHYIWKGRWPDNQAPHISSIVLDNKHIKDNVRLTAGQQYTASVNVNELDGDAVRYHWELRYESTATQVGGDRESLPATIDGLVSGTGANVVVTAPQQSGAYRLFVYAYDNANNAAHANFPFYVN